MQTREGARVAEGARRPCEISCRKPGREGVQLGGEILCTDGRCEFRGDGVEE